jgi:CubicO group peptidase (beta-lactamase class C family)
MKRREFLKAGGGAALGLAFTPLVAGLEAGQNAAGPDAAARGLIADLEREIPELMAAAEVPGVSIALVENGSLMWRRGFGVRDIRSKVPVDTDTVFEAASTSKPVFAYAVMKLCERGVLSHDTPLTRYTPERILENEPRVDMITARHVLAHTSGLPNWRSKQEPLAVQFTPGERWSYSGEGYSYLQAVVSRLTGGLVNRSQCGSFEAGLQVCATEPSIDDYMRANMFGPLGMTSTAYLWTDRIESHVAWGHDPKGQPLPTNRKPSGPSVTRYGVAGGMYSTPTDYARFLVQVVAPGPPDAFRLTQASLDEMLRPQVKREPQRSWALGWEISHGEAGDVIRHAGGNPGFSCFVAASVKRKAGYVIMTNREDTGFFGVIVKLIGGSTLARLLGTRLEP